MVFTVVVVGSILLPVGKQAVSLAQVSGVGISSADATIVKILKDSFVLVVVCFLEEHYCNVAIGSLVGKVFLLIFSCHVKVNLLKACHRLN